MSEQQRATLEAEPLVIDDHSSDFNEAIAYYNPDTGQTFMDVHPRNEGDFEAFRVLIKPDEVRQALNHPQSYGQEGARILLSALFGDSEQQAA